MKFSSVPWRDDCLLPQESVYSCFSKIAWFQAMTPAQYLRNCRTDTVKAQVVRLDAYPAWRLALRNTAVMPMVAGNTLLQWLDHLVEQEQVQIPTLWRSSMLRLCDACLQEGVHLAIHQHMGLSHCPLHHRRLRSVCLYCKEPLGFTLHLRTAAFCCDHCGHRLTASQALFAPRRPSHSAHVQEQLDELASSLRWLEERVPAHWARWLSVRGSIDDSACVPHLGLEALCRTGKPHRAIRRLASSDTSISLHPVVATEPATQQALWFDRAQFGQAAYYVRSWFLRERGRSHAHCLDAPVHMYGESLQTDASAPEDLFACCPVAIAFWFWRQSVADQLRYLPEPAAGRPRAEHRDGLLLAYKTLKTQLTHAMLVARQMSDGHQSRLVSRAGRLTELSGLVDLTYRDFFTGQSTSGAITGELLHLRLAPSFSKWQCRGSRAYVRRLRRRLAALRALVDSHAEAWMELTDDRRSQLPTTASHRVMRADRQMQMMLRWDHGGTWIG